MDEPSSPQLIGVLNVTPDSFSDGGRFLAPERALAHAEYLVAAGAAWVDVGAESTRPGFAPVPVAEELERLRPILDGLAARNISVSLDTMKPEAARLGLERKIAMINDVRGLQGGDGMAREIASFCTDDYRPQVVLMHWRKSEKPQEDVAWNALTAYFDRSIELGLQAGLRDGQFILDIGLGFDKTSDCNLRLLRKLPALKAHYGLPILVGASRKRFLSRGGLRNPDERLAAGLAAGMFAAWNGADILRVHDAREYADFFAMWKEIDA